MSDIDNPPPEARIRQVGRWRYYIEIHHGMMQWGPDGGGWFAFGRRRAGRKAARLLRRYLLDNASRETWTISAEEVSGV